MGNLARDVLFRTPSARLYFLSANCAIHAFSSDKIKGKSALKARTFLHERDKVHVCYWFRLSMHLSTENSAGSNIFKTLHWRNVSMHLSTENSAGSNIFKTLHWRNVYL